jgi:outer membrane protein OmpA-like peptidoglycan-associated protein
LLLSLTIRGSKPLIFFAVDYILPCFWPWFGHNPHGQRFWFLALKNITQKEIFVHSLGLFGSSKLTSKVVVIALAAGLLGAGVAVVSPAEPAKATSCSSAATGYAAGSGDGTSTATAFRIATAAHLIRLTNTSGDFDKYFIQTADIDLAGCEWTPIGSSAAWFIGQYDGGGFAIEGLSITLASTFADDRGLFGVVSNTVIRDLTVKGSIASSTVNVGGVVGLGSGTTTLITQVHSEVDVTYTAGNYAGGIIGSMVSGTLSYSSYAGNLSASNEYANIAGLVGYGQLQIISSYSRATLSGTSTYKAGLHGWASPRLTKSYSASTGVNAGIASSGISLSSGNFWDTTVGTLTASRTGPLTGATGKSTSELKEIATFTAASWDIVDGWEPFSSTSSPAKIWGICSRVNDGYPFLLWEYTTDPCTVAPPPSSSGSGSSGSVYVAPVVVPEVVPSTIRQPTIRQATDEKPARLLGRSLNKDVLFIADSARLSPEAKKSLRQAARLAKASDGKVAVTGFAAMTGRGSAYEKSVAQKRALVVARYLRAQGVKTWIYYQGLAGRQGMAFDGDPRRVEIRILK